MFLFNKYRTSKQSGLTGDTIDVRWKTNLLSHPPKGAESTAVIDNVGNIYFGCHNGLFYSLDCNGKIRWSFSTSTKIYSSPVLFHNRVYFAGGDGYVYALDVSTGAAQWIFDLGKGYRNRKQKLMNLPWTYSLPRRKNMDTYCWSSLLLLDNMLFITGFGKGAYCLDTEGNEIWSIDLGFPRFQLSGMVADDENRVYFASRSGYFYCIDIKGNIIWRISIGNYNVWGNPSFNEKQKDIYLPISQGENTGSILSISKNGDINWKLNLQSAIYGSVAINERNNILYCGDFKGFLYEINAESGIITQRKQLSSATRALWTTPTIDNDGNIYITTKRSNTEGDIIKMNSKFDEIWKFPLGKALSVPVILSNGDIIAGSWDGYYYCFRTRNI